MTRDIVRREAVPASQVLVVIGLAVLGAGVSRRAVPGRRGGSSPEHQRHEPGGIGGACDVSGVERAGDAQA